MERVRMEETVQHWLRELGRLAEEEVEIVKTGDKQLMDKIDRQIEAVMGEKERALGGLYQHRAEHGC